MKSYATQDQCEEIKKLGKIVFNGDIEQEAFLVFSSWLQQCFGCFEVGDITSSVAPKVIIKLKEMANITKPNRVQAPSYEKCINQAAQMYLKGIKDGQKYPDRKPPPLKKIISKIKMKMGVE